MATNPKDNPWIYGTKANAIRTQRERRDDAIQKRMTILPPLPKIDYSKISISPPRSVSPSLSGPNSLPDVHGQPRVHGGQPYQSPGPAGKPADFTKVVGLVGGVFGAIYAGAHGANTAVGMGIAFVVSFVVAGTLFHYAKWVLAIVFVAGLIYALSH